MNNYIFASQWLQSTPPPFSFNVRVIHDCIKLKIRKNHEDRKEKKTKVV